MMSENDTTSQVETNLIAFNQHLRNDEDNISGHSSSPTIPKISKDPKLSGDNSRGSKGNQLGASKDKLFRRNQQNSFGDLPKNMQK